MIVGGNSPYHILSSNPDYAPVSNRVASYIWQNSHQNSHQPKFLFCRILEEWCREGDSNPHNHFWSADFKSAASASFAIPA
jgi:hypothetical protein